MVQLIHLRKVQLIYVNRRGITGRDARIDWALGDDE